MKIVKARDGRMFIVKDATTTHSFPNRQEAIRFLVIRKEVRPETAKKFVYGLHQKGGMGTLQLPFGGPEINATVTATGYHFKIKEDMSRQKHIGHGQWVPRKTSTP